jgi:oligopeptide transport system substrate-binding protein
MKILRILGVATLFAAPLSGCRPENKKSNTQLELALSDDVKTLDPALANDVISVAVIEHIYETLLEFEYLGNLGQMRPQLAARMPTLSKDGRTLEIELLPGVRFGQSPRTVVAEDFIYSWKRVADPRLSSSSFWLLDGVIVGINEWRSRIESAKDAAAKDAAFQMSIPGLSAPSPLKLVVRLNQPSPVFLYALAMSPLAVVQPEHVKTLGPDFASKPLGTGPFELRSWLRGSSLQLARNPGFRGEIYKAPQPDTVTTSEKVAGLTERFGQSLPFVEAVRFHIIKEEQPRWLKFLSGDLDETSIPKDFFADTVEANGELKQSLKDKGIRLFRAPSMTSWWIEFNLKDPLLGKNLKLRQALAHAFDRKKALELIYNNRGTLSDSPVPSFIEGAQNQSPAPFSYDPARAKQLLAEAGYPDGKGLPRLTMDLRGPGTAPRHLAELIQRNFADIGVPVDILANSFPEALEKMKRSKFQIILGGWAADYPDAENYLQLFASANLAPGTNSAWFINAEYDALYKAIRAMPPSADRTQKVQRMIQILQRDLPIIPFFVAQDYRVVHSRVQNYKYHLLTRSHGKYWALK